MDALLLVQPTSIMASEGFVCATKGKLNKNMEYK